MHRPSLHWLRRFLIISNWVLLSLGVLVIVDYWSTQDPAILRMFFAYLAGPFYVFCGLVEAWFAFVAARGFDPEEPMRLPWLMLSVAGIYHTFSNLLGNILNQPAWVNPLYWFAPNFVTNKGTELREIGLRYFGDTRFALIGLAFWLVLRAERRAGLKWGLNPSEVFVLLVTGVWIGIHSTVAVNWLGSGQTNLPLSRYASWGVDFIIGLVLVMAIFVRSSVKPLEPGMIAAPWKCYSWGVFFTCMGNASIWLTSYSIAPGQPFHNLMWLIWFPQVTMFALGPVWQCEAMRAAAGEWIPAPDSKFAAGLKVE